MGPTIKIEKINPGLGDIESVLRKLSRVEVLVGIPAPKASRKGEPINNPSLLYIQTHGSPIRGIPPRPLIEPAIAADGNRQPIAAELGKSAQSALGGDAAEASRHLRRAGMEGMNAVKKWFFDPRNNWPANKPGTIRAKGSDQPLIGRTGSLRQSITYVVRGE